jgi:regulator of sirC expression with transglutaminase-like and TPR domain
LTVVGGAHPPEQIALAIERDLLPHVDGGPCMRTLDGWAAQLPPASSFVEVSRVLYDLVGLRGAHDYDAPEESLITSVVSRRQGLPVLLAVVAIAVAARAGVELEPIAFPGHFLVRDKVTHTYLDPASGRHPVSEDELRRIARQVHADPREAARRLEPVDSRALAVRMLLNLGRAFAKHSDHARALVVHDRLFALTGSPAHRCERAAHALAIGAVESAIEDFEAYLAAEPEAADRKAIERILRQAKRRERRPLLN